MILRGPFQLRFCMCVNFCTDLTEIFYLLLFSTMEVFGEILKRKIVKEKRN